MGLLAGDITHGQAVALVLLCIFLIVFIVVDVYLVLFLRRGNKKLAKSVEKTIDGESGDEGTSNPADERYVDPTEIT